MVEIIHRTLNSFGDRKCEMSRVVLCRESKDAMAPCSFVFFGSYPLCSLNVLNRRRCKPAGSHRRTARSTTRQLHFSLPVVTTRRFPPHLSYRYRNHNLKHKQASSHQRRCVSVRHDEGKYLNPFREQKSCVRTNRDQILQTKVPSMRLSC